MTSGLMVAGGGCGTDSDDADAASADASSDADRAETNDTHTLDASATSAIASISPAHLDWGERPPGEDFDIQVDVTNTSSGTLTIQDVKADCRCTVFEREEYIGRTLEPGEQVQILATVQGRPLPGERGSSVKVKFIESDAIFEAKFTGEYTLPIRTEPRMLNMQDSRSTTRFKPEALTGTVRVESVDGRPFRVLSTNGEAPAYADGFDPERDEPRSSYVLRYDVSRETEESMREFWLIETDHPACPVVDVWVRHPWAQRRTMPENPAGGLRLTRGSWLTLSHKRVMVGDISAARSAGGGADAQFAVRVRKPGTKTVQRVYTDSKVFTASIASTESDGEDTVLTIDLTLTDREFRGVLYDVLWVEAESARAPVYIIGRVVGAEGT